MSTFVDIKPGSVEANAALVQWFAKFGQQCVREGQRLAGERISGGTGAYERSFDVELVAGNPPTLRFGNLSPVAIYVEEDTRPHVIRPKPLGRRSFTNPDRPGALRWFQGAAGGGAGPANLHFAAEVHHPGTKGQHIIRDAVSAAADTLRA